MQEKPRRATIYFDPEVQRALRLRAAESERSLSDLVNEAVRRALLDEEDARAPRDTAEPPAAYDADSPSDLDPRLVRQIKKRAAETGESPRQLLERAVRDFLRRQPTREAFRFEPLVKRGRVVPGIDWDDRDSLYERMEGRR